MLWEMNLAEKSQILGKGITTDQMQCERKHSDVLLEFANKKRPEQRFNNVIILTEDEKFPANKMVLSCFSEYFDKMFDTEMCEKYQDEVMIKGVSKIAMKLLIDFIYTGKITINKENVCYLLSASDMLRLEDVKNYCTEFLEKSINVGTCFSILLLADMYRSVDLQKKVRDFIAENIEDAVLCNEFKSLNKDCLLSFINKQEIPAASQYKAYVEWTKYDLVNRRAVFPSLLMEINFNLLPIEFLEDVISQEELVHNDVCCLKLLLHGIVKVSKESRAKGRFSRVVSIGGSETLTEVMEIFSVSTEKKKIFPNLSVGRYGLCVALLDGCIYVMGGSSERNLYQIATNFVSHLDMTADTLEWEDCAPMLENRNVMGAAVLSDTIYVVGGSNKDGEHLSSGEYYIPSHNKWGCIPSMKLARSGHAVVACKGYLYSIGGFGNHHHLDSVERLHCSSSSWDDVAHMQTRRRWLAAVVIDNKIYAIGGQSGKFDNTILKSVESYDVTTDEWTYVCDMSVERSSFCACVVQGKIYVSGGLNARNDSVKIIECYDPATDEWTIVGETEEEWFNHRLIAI